MMLYRILYYFILTLLLPRCYLKTNDNNAKFEILTPFFVVVLISEKISVKAILKVDLFDIGPENIPFAGMCGLFSPEIIRAGAVKGLRNPPVALSSLLPPKEEPEHTC